MGCGITPNSEKTVTQFVPAKKNLDKIVGGSDSVIIEQL